jgi:hypothetical protein
VTAWIRSELISLRLKTNAGMRGLAPRISAIS